jgi:hypothetical protein
LFLTKNLNSTGKFIKENRIKLFGRGDRVIIETGYDGNLKEVFRGYIVRVGLDTPLVIDCEDQMFGLKQMRFSYNSGTGKIALSDLIKKMLTINNNPWLTASQDVFGFGIPLNTESLKDANLIPVFLGLDTVPFSYSTIREKSVAEVLVDLRKKLMIFSFFDDFGNLNFQLPFMNSNLINTNFLKTFHFEKQIVSEHNMKFQNENEMSLKIIFGSARSDKTAKPQTLYANNPGTQDKYVGDSIGDSITVNGPEDMSQKDLDKYALQMLTANKFTGFAKGSSFETFGEPAVYIGQGVKLISDKYPEKSGNYAIVGIKRKFGMNGYRQQIEIGIELPSQNLSQIIENQINLNATA